MTLGIQRIFLNKKPRSTQIWCLILVQDGSFNTEIGLYTAPSYLIVTGNCKKELKYQIASELSHWEITDMVEAQQFCGFKEEYPSVSLLHDLDPDLEKKIAKLVMLAKLKM
jgi:hypothetical protein